MHNAHANLNLKLTLLVPSFLFNYSCTHSKFFSYIKLSIIKGIGIFLLGIHYFMVFTLLS